MDWHYARVLQDQWDEHYGEIARGISAGNLAEPYFDRD